MGILYGKGSANTLCLMKVSDTDFRFMVECLERDVATLLVEERHMTIHQALDTLFNSVTYTKLQNPQTGLYFQSPRYIYSFLEQEISEM